MKLKFHNIWPFVLITAIYIASSQSTIAVPKTGHSYDKIAHFLVFGLLATSIIRIPFIRDKGWFGILATVLITSSCGGLDELHQLFTEGRSVEFSDWVADTLGSILASILYVKWGWYRSMLEQNFPKKHKSTTKACTAVP